MKNICSFRADKYAAPAYTEIEPGIYQCEDGFVTSLCFEQEPEFGEDYEAGIAQYPLEDVLDRFLVYVSDFYPEINAPGSARACLEFCGEDAESLRDLRTVIGKHVYNRIVEEDGLEYAELVIE